MSDLTILCVTRQEPYAQPFLARLAQDASVIGADLRVETDGAGVTSTGFIESALDAAVARCADGYVLRIDDDEIMSLPLLEWLRSGAYRTADHWAFARRNLWPDAQRFITNPPLWPDLQTRLSVKAKAADRPSVHQGSPYGTGDLAPSACTIDHHKFLARDRADREALVRRYDEIQPGAGSDYIMFSLPELYDGELEMAACA